MKFLHPPSKHVISSVFNSPCHGHGHDRGHDPHMAVAAADIQ
jgi:hypothetical protein